MKHIFTPRKGNVRYRMHLSLADIRKIERGHEWQADVTNIDDGKRYRVKGAECGSPSCFCDAVIVKELKKEGN